nr:hypothetical protein CFP56_03691 [Quercus suber]
MGWAARGGRRDGVLEGLLSFPGSRLRPFRYLWAQRPKSVRSAMCAELIASDGIFSSYLLLAPDRASVLQAHRQLCRNQILAGSNLNHQARTVHSTIQ